MASQRTPDDTLDFIRTNLTSRQDADSMSEETLQNKPTDADIRRLFQEKILTREPFTFSHQVVFCTIPGAARAITFAFNELLYSQHRAHTTKLSIIMTGGINIGRDWNEDAFEKHSWMRFFKNGDEEVPGALLWEVEVVSVSDASGGRRKELKHNTIHVWVPHKPGVSNGEYEAHLGWHYVEWFNECLEIGNKKPGRPSAKYFEHIPFSDEPRVWDTSNNQVNSIAMAIMHLLAIRIANVDPSDDKETSLQKLLQDDIVTGHCIAEWEDTDRDKPPFFSMRLLFWAITCPAELAAKIMG